MCWLRYLQLRPFLCSAKYLHLFWKLRFWGRAQARPRPSLTAWLCPRSAASGSVHLSVITCCRCMRKVGLWGFHQLESVGPELDSCSMISTLPAPAERIPLVPTSPRRMLTRSQDSLPPGSEQVWPSSAGPW